MCEVEVFGDEVSFKGPELEVTMAYLSVREVADRVTLEEGGLRASPALPELVATLKSLCEMDVSSLLLDVKESLLHMGWLVEGQRDVVRIRKSKRLGVSGFVAVEYDKVARRMSVVTTEKCVADLLAQRGFQVRTSKYLVEAEGRVATIPEALRLEEELTC